MNLPATVPKLIWFLVGCATLGLGLTVAASFAARLHWAFDLLTHFRVHYAAAAILLAACYAVGRRFRAAAFATSLAIVNLWFIAPYYLPSNQALAAAADVRPLKIVSINLLFKSSDYADVVDYVRATQADLVVFVELTAAWQTGLAPLLADYPESHFHPRTDPFGLGLLSKLPLEDVRFENMITEYPLVRARLKVDGRPLTIFGVHPTPPNGRLGASLRNGAFAALADKVRGIGGAVIVAGDLNTTNWSPYFDDLLAGTRLRDSRLGRGLQTTWPTSLPGPARISIDHFLVSPEIRITERKVGPYIGSDHLPIEMEFSITK